MRISIRQLPARWSFVLLLAGGGVLGFFPGQARSQEPSAIIRFPAPEEVGSPNEVGSQNSPNGAVQSAPDDPFAGDDLTGPPAAGLGSKRLGEIAVGSRPPEGDIPRDDSTRAFQASDAGTLGRNWALAEFPWLPTRLTHQPLYFDDVVLERYGQSRSAALQPVLSSGRFFGTIPLMPARLLIDRPYDRVYAYGHPRPGSPAPCLHQKFGR